MRVAKLLSRHFGRSDSLEMSSIISIISERSLESDMDYQRNGLILIPRGFSRSESGVLYFYTCKEAINKNAVLINTPRSCKLVNNRKKWFVDSLVFHSRFPKCIEVGDVFNAESIGDGSNYIFESEHEVSIGWENTRRCGRVFRLIELPESENVDFCHADKIELTNATGIKGLNGGLKSDFRAFYLFGKISSIHYLYEQNILLTRRNLRSKHLRDEISNKESKLLKILDEYEDSKKRQSFLDRRVGMISGDVNLRIIAETIFQKTSCNFFCMDIRIDKEGIPKILDVADGATKDATSTGFYEGSHVCGYICKGIQKTLERLKESSLIDMEKFFYEQRDHMKRMTSESEFRGINVSF